LGWEDGLDKATYNPKRTLTAVERAELDAEHRAHVAYWDDVYGRLKVDAQACARSMRFSPTFGDPPEPNKFEDIVSKSLDDYRSGRALMEHMGADRLIDPATTGMLLAIRRGLLEETNVATIGDYVLTDMAVIAFASAMRIQSIVGNLALVLEGDLFGQPSLRAKWRQECGGRPDGLAVDEHVRRLREQIMPLVERFNRMGREGLEALGRTRQTPSLAVERAEAINIVLVASTGG